MVLGSHNSWSYLPARHWWMRPFSFMAKCQSADVKTQYEKYGVRCFDLRIRYVKWKLQVVHGLMVYDYSERQLLDDLKYLNAKGDCYIRLLHDARDKVIWEKSKPFFQSFCHIKISEYPNIKFWCGRNLYDWTYDYQLGEIPCKEKYSSVCKPKWLDDWWPWLFAKLNNHKAYNEGTDKTILLIDFVDIK